MVVLAPAIRGLGLVLAADKASLDASLGILTATSALLATKWATKSLVVVAKEADGAPTDATEWEAHPLIKPKSMWSVFSPRNIVITAVKSVLIPFGLLLDGWFEQVRSEEALAELENRDIDWPPFPKHRVRPAMITAAYQFVKDMTVTAVRLLLQNLVWQHAPLWVANKSLKDFRRSAIRKYNKTVWYIRGETTTQRKLMLRRLGIIAYTNIFRCTISLLVASAAAGLGSFLAGPYPGLGASASFLIADTASQLVLVPYLLTR